MLEYRTNAEGRVNWDKMKKSIRGRSGYSEGRIRLLPLYKWMYKYMELGVFYIYTPLLLLQRVSPTNPPSPAEPPTLLHLNCPGKGFQKCPGYTVYRT